MHLENERLNYNSRVDYFSKTVASGVECALVSVGLLRRVLGVTDEPQVATPAGEGDGEAASVGAGECDIFVREIGTHLNLHLLLLRLF